MNRDERDPAVDPIWQQSPDGRPVKAEGDFSQALGSAGPDTPDIPRLRELEPFLQSCASMLPASLEDGQIRLGLLLFVLGAADRFWSIHGLDDSRFPPYAESLLERFGLSPKLAATVVAALPQLPEDAFARTTLRQGGDTLESWLASRDPNVTLWLTELIAGWRRR